MNTPANDNPVIAPKTRLGRWFENYLDFVPKITSIVAFASILLNVTHYGAQEIILVGCASILLLLFIVISIWKMRSTTVNKRALAWSASLMITFSMMQISSSVLDNKHRDGIAFQNTLAKMTAEIVLENENTDNALSPYNHDDDVIKHGRNWTITSQPLENEFSLLFEFSNKYACRFYLQKARPFTGTLINAKIGDSEYTTWPSKSDILNECEESFTATYKRNS